jgi:hypothetical protein
MTKVAGSAAQKKTRFREARVVEIKASDIRGKKVPLTGAMDLFPSQYIGGASRRERAESLVAVKYEGGDVVFTDVDQTKKILRDRTGASAFYARLAAKAGDFILITRTGRGQYEMALLRRVGVE